MADAIRAVGRHLAALAMLAAGCGGPSPAPGTPRAAVAPEATTIDPASGRLAPGTEAVVRVPPWADTTKKPAMEAALYDVPGRGYADSPMIPAGTRVRVASDERPTKMEGSDPPDTDGVVDSRYVQVLILEGEHKGLSGLIPRNELRAVK